MFPSLWAIGVWLLAFIVWLIADTRWNAVRERGPEPVAIPIELSRQRKEQS
jgi:hypothetical protein